jgi:putative salt-induced outer membrane protein YdiY
MKNIFKVLCISLLLVSTQAFAIINVESMRVQKKSDGFSGELELDSDLLSGNTDSKHASFGNRLQWDYGNKTNFIITSYSYGESSGVRDVNKGYIHLRHIEHLNQKWAWESFGQIEQNEFTRLNYRGLIGGGVRRTLHQDDDKSGMYLGLGGFYSTETLDDNTTTNLVRSNIYFVIKRKLNDTNRFMSTTYYQPAIDGPDNFRVLEQLTYEIAINKKLNLSISLDVSHNSQPPAGVQPTDTGFHTGIKYSF